MFIYSQLSRSFTARGFSSRDPTRVYMVRARTKQTSEQTRTNLGTCTYLGLFSIFIYKHGTCRYVRLKALNVLNVHGPRFNAPINCDKKNEMFKATVSSALILYYVTDLSSIIFAVIV